MWISCLVFKKIVRKKICWNRFASSWDTMVSWYVFDVMSSSFLHEERDIVQSYDFLGAKNPPHFVGWNKSWKLPYLDNMLRLESSPHKWPGQTNTHSWYLHLHLVPSLHLLFEWGLFMTMLSPPKKLLLDFHPFRTHPW
jgi:hypothetical protein